MGKVGKLNVALERPFYLPGDTVNGVVYLELKEPIDVDKVYVKVKGKEKVKWKSTFKEPVWEEVEGVRSIVRHEEIEEEFEDKESFFKKKIKLIPDGELNTGKYAFPFQFELPRTGKKGGPLSGSFDAKGQLGTHFGGTRGIVSDLKAKVEYSLKAVVDIDDSKDLEEKLDFIIYETVPKEIPTPSGANTAQVMLCCCIPRGDLTMRATIDKNVYHPGEICEAILEVENRSQLDVVAMAELNRIITLKADKGEKLVHRIERNLGRFDVIHPDETKTVKLKFEIPGNVLPSTRSRNIECRYVLDIVSELQCAPDIEIHFPVHILQRPIDKTVWLAKVEDHQNYVVNGTTEVSDMQLQPGYV